MSLRIFHLLFVLLVIVGADLFGVWAIRDYRANGDGWALILGVLTLVGGLGLVVYSVLLVRKLDRARIR